MIKNKVKYYQLNEQGRDFVVGDIHGCYELFREMLKNINFNYATDRMFSVGDLVDRGPSSMDCLNLLYAPWFHAVYANHEDFMLYALKKPYTSTNEGVVCSWIANGGSWHPFEDQQLLDDICDRIKDQVPYVNVVQTPKGRVNIVHAQIHDNADGEPATDEDIDKWNFHDINETSMIWSRTIFQQRGGRMVPKLQPGRSITYAGHSVTPIPFQSRSHRFIDTGAVYGYLDKEESIPPYGLTAVDLTNDTVHFINAITLEHKETPCSEQFSV